ncbi:MAG TPA: alpha/beta fold hydrolase [Solirubrobacteraceae bacterium]|jgi:pimeloyl-ACP methyl ester carboxylesterase|nr:alpha/beta fold hydrolase [Solirubrobacteraceae bacterium]
MTPTASTDAPADERVRVGDVDLRVLRAGSEGEHVLFVHGNPGSADDWHGSMAAVAGTARAIAIDLPDFGETRAPKGFAHSVAAYADFLERAREALGIERVHLVLHDFGGPIGLLWAATHPDAVASVTLIDTGVLPDYRWHILARIWRTPVGGELFQATTTRPAFRFVVNLQEPQTLPRAFLDGMYRHYGRRTRRAVLRLYRATSDPSGMSREVTGRLRELDLPALVIWGEHDAYLPASYAWRQREAFPSAEVHVLATSGHWPFVDAAPTVERLLSQFLAATVDRPVSASSA